LQAALGYSIAQNLFISKKNVLVEGPADLILLQHVSALLEQQGKSGLDEGILVPVGGLDKLATFIALLGANKLKIVVLHDKAGASNQGVENMVRQKLIEKKNVLDYAMFRTPTNSESDVEDLFPPALYIDSFNSVYARELKGVTLTSADLVAHPRIVEGINLWLKDKGIVLRGGGGFNHYRVAQALLPRLTVASLGPSDLQCFATLFQRLNNALS
jgi:hypothetical protein